MSKINISDKIIAELIEAADKARDNSYAPYSRYRVGAALYAATDSGEDMIITGCNVENASYPAGNCAERTAVFKAVSDGYNNFKAIAIVGGNNAYTSPCGICRQVLREFVAPDEFYVIMAKSKTDYVMKTLEELLPMSFGPDNLAGV
ncbi:MAG: cytidine deaminase [Lachnospiraceae bacterium]|nr:cytidine deaminase [Lachnospiraceae bacterium]